MKRGVVGGRVKEIRDRLEWSQDELCARLKDCGYPVLQPNLSLMEQGKRKIDADAIPCFAEVLGVEPNDLYGFRKSSLTEEEEEPREQAPTRAPDLEFAASFAEDMLGLARISPARMAIIQSVLRGLDEAGVE